VVPPLPDEDRSAIVVIVYRGGSSHSVLRTRVTSRQVTGLAETWTALLQVLDKRAAGDGAGQGDVDLAAPPPPRRAGPVPPARHPRGLGGARFSPWTAARAT
jgi:hypothetical protein